MNARRILAAALAAVAVVAATADGQTIRKPAGRTVGAVAPLWVPDADNGLVAYRVTLDGREAPVWSWWGPRRLADCRHAYSWPGRRVAVLVDVCATRPTVRAVGRGRGVVRVEWWPVRWACTTRPDVCDWQVRR